VGLSGHRQNADIADTLHLRDVAMTTPFCLLMGYNFGCMIASGTLLILGVVFGVKLSDEDIPDFELLRDVAMATMFGFKGCCHGNHVWLSIYWVHIGAT